MEPPEPRPPVASHECDAAAAIGVAVVISLLGLRLARSTVETLLDRAPEGVSEKAAAAIKAVHPGLRVGGPASAAAGWTRELLAHLDASGAPLDFLSTHVYGNVPLDLRPVLASAGRAGTPAWWTEWGPTPTHFNPVGDTVFAAAFLLRGMASALGRIAALSPWVASDHFEELGPPPELFHGGFGLL